LACHEQQFLNLIDAAKDAIGHQAAQQSSAARRQSPRHLIEFEEPAGASWPITSNDNPVTKSTIGWMAPAAVAPNQRGAAIGLQRKTERQLIDFDDTDSHG
jgi:hypothetical protein